MMLTLRAIVGAFGIALLVCGVGACDLVSTDAGGGQPGTPTATAIGPRAIAILGAPGVYDETAWLTFLRAYPFAVTRVDLISAPLGDRALVAFDIVILDRLSRIFDADEAATLASWVHRGGSLLALAGYVNNEEDQARQNSLLAALPVRYAPGLIAMGPFRYVSDFSAHPTTAGLRSVPFWGGYRVTLTGTCDGPSQTVASLDGDPVAVACQHGAGRVYVWGDEWVEYSSQWASGTDAPRFWQDAMDWLAHRS
jgi:hypothetical protein